MPGIRARLVIAHHKAGLTVPAKEITAGCFLLLTASSWLGKGIAWFENLWRSEKRYFSHAAVVLAEIDGSMVVLESTWPRVKVTPLAAWLTAEGPGIVCVPLRVGWTATMNARAWTFATPFIGRWYNALAIPIMALWEILGKETPPVPQIEGMVCSVLATATVEAGLGISDPDPRSIDPDSIPDLQFVGTGWVVAP